MSTSYTNESIEAEICVSPADLMSIRVRTGNATDRYILPSCVSQSQLASIQGANLIITDWRHLPPTILVASLSYSTFEPAAVTDPTPSPSSSESPFPSSFSANSGFNADGTVNWDAVFASHPLLSFYSLSHTTLRGSLPVSLPSYVNFFLFTYVPLSGTIPSTLFANSAKTTYVTLSNLDLSGSIPAGLFNNSWINSFGAANNSLTGTLPDIGASLGTLELSGSSIDFCHPSSATALDSFNGTCLFSYT